MNVCALRANVHIEDIINLEEHLYWEWLISVQQAVAYEISHIKIEVLLLL